MRIWNISRTGTDIANNNRKRLTGSEPGLVSYYKFNEGAGDIAKDFNTSREVKKRNDATIYGLGTAGTKWETQLAYYKTRQVDSTPDNDDDDMAPSQNVPPGEDIVLYRILSCGTGPHEALFHKIEFYTKRYLHQVVHSVKVPYHHRHYRVCCLLA